MDGNDSPLPDVRQLSDQALGAIRQLAEPLTWETLQLTKQRQFDWLPTNGGLICDIAYDLFVPLAYYQLNAGTLNNSDQQLLGLAYRSVTWHYVLAEMPPALVYYPERRGWRSLRYENPASCWMQGLAMNQLRERLDRFFIIPNANQTRRVATRREFKAEFARVLNGDSCPEQDRRSLGVLVNPLFGFTPLDRPVFWRVLAVQQQLYSILAGRPSNGPFAERLRELAELFIHDVMNGKIASM